jgi:branched-chain amino acid transport system substrate-binding protein
VKWRAAAAVVPLALLAGACGSENPVTAVATNACGAIRYEGEGRPDVIVVSDLPLRGVGAPTTKLMVQAVELVLRERGFRAGKYRVGYQSCNDTVGDEPYDPLRCKQNARAYVAAEDVVGIIGPWNSGCAVEQIPIVSRTTAGPLVMISPSNTFAPLTRDVRGAEPMAARLYPDGVRSYARVVTHDFVQGSAAAQLAHSLGGKRVALVHQSLSDDYVRGLALSFRSSARRLGLAVREFEWRETADYRSLAASVAAARPAAVYLAGLPLVNGKRLIEDLRAALPRGVAFIGPDSFAAAEAAQALGPAGEGMYATVPTIPAKALPPAGVRLLRKLGVAADDPRLIASPGVPEAAQATEVLLDAIARSDGTRATVVAHVLATKVKGGILGSFSFDRFGDMVPGPVGIFRFQGGKVVTVGIERAIPPGV